MMGGGSHPNEVDEHGIGWSSRSSDDLIHITNTLNISSPNPNIPETDDEETTNPWESISGEQPHEAIGEAGKSKRDDISEDSNDSFDKPLHPLPLGMGVVPGIPSTKDPLQPSMKDSKDQNGRGHLLFCKSHVYIHPTPHSKDNIEGILGVAEVSNASSQLSVGEANDKGKGKIPIRGKKVVLFWIPISLAWELGEEERYRMWEDKMMGKEGVDVLGVGIGTRGGKEMNEVVDGKQGDEYEDEYVFVTLPTSTSSPQTSESKLSPEEYAFSVPLSQVYSLLVYPPTLSNWYGSVTINMLGGFALSSLHFHDDESPSTIHLMSASPTSNSSLSPTPGGTEPRAGRLIWGATPFFALLRDGTLCDLLRSRLEPNLYLVNPSRGDREVHEIELSEDEDGVVPKSMRVGGEKKKHGKEVYPPPAGFPSTIAFPTYASDGTREGHDLDLPIPSFPYHPARTHFLSSFSMLTQQAKQLTTSVLSHPLAKPLVPHLPEPVRSLVTVPGEWESMGERQKRIREAKAGGKKGRNAVVGEYESARVYLARWARIVAEEGERARKAEVASNATFDNGKGGIQTSAEVVGVFEVIRSSRSGVPLPNTTRQPDQPITEEDFLTWHEKGLDESYLRREGFRRGCSTEGRVRQWVWEVYLGVLGWEVGLGTDRKTAIDLREQKRKDLKVQYEHLRKQWQDASASASPSSEETISKAREEWHRIDSSLLPHRLPLDDRRLLETLPVPVIQVDCRRTDRNQELFAVPDEYAGDEEKEAGGAGYNGGMGESEPGSQTALNPHVAALRTILMTYHMYSPTLGYVQGMSDLLSPIYVVFQADEAGSFWAFTGLMKMMENNFLRDQSGMRAKLSTLQHLIRVMDPELYVHLENTDSLNLFFCFRWILIIFKREFPFGDIPRLWDVLFSHYYTSSFELFVALAILSEHRDIICRYLVEFDEVLKYANDLSGTIDLDSVIAQAEVLFLSFRSLVEEVDRNETIRAGESIADEGLRQRKAGSTTTPKPTTNDEAASQQVSSDLRALLNPWRA